MSIPVQVPGNFVPAYAVAYGAVDTGATFVDGDHPLPVRDAYPAALSAPLVGTAAQAVVAGPFLPERGRPVWLTLSGSWSGSVRVLRSIDGGASKIALTIAGEPWARFTGNCNEAFIDETEAAASYYLEIDVTGGTISYRVAQ